MVEKTTNNTQRFWKAYAEGNFVSLKRHENANYEGILMDFGQNEEALLGEEAPFSITRKELLDYDYSTDDQFAPCLFENIESALSFVLRNPEFAEPTEPNRNRLQLIIRFIRDPSTAEPSYSLTLRTRDLVKDYAEKIIQKDHLIGQLRNLRKGRDKNFEILCQTVLKYLDMGTFSVEQATSLLYANTPVPDIKHILILRVLIETVSHCELSVERACRFLEEMLPTKANYMEMLDSGKISLVHAERDILLKALSMCQTDERITTQLMKILDNHENEDLFTVTETISALGIHNDKSSIPPLVEYLDRDDITNYQDNIEDVLQLLCSGPELIPKAIFGMDLSKYTDEELEDLDNNEGQEPKIEHEYWLKKAGTLSGTPADWLRQDSASVFWQKRLRCALLGKDSKVPPQMLSKLQNDEVMTVRVAAGGPETIGS